MRIVSGQWRGRAIATLPEGDDTIRPTADRAREAVFNILFSRLGSFDGLRVLDACCGTGALGLEALSRGAAHCTFIDNNPTALRLVKQTLQAFDATGRATMVLSDAGNLPAASAVCDLVLCDPPYNSGLATKVLAQLSDKGWLSPAAVMVVEIAAREGWDVPAGFRLVDERTYGAAKVGFIEYP